jgi:hypothetical protein
MSYLIVIDLKSKLSLLALEEFLAIIKFLFTFSDNILEKSVLRKHNEN